MRPWKMEPEVRRKGWEWNRFEELGKSGLLDTQPQKSSRHLDYRSPDQHRKH